MGQAAACSPQPGDATSSNTARAQRAALRHSARPPRLAASAAGSTPVLLLGLRLALLAIAAFCPRTLAQPGGGAAEVLASLDPAACPVAVSFETNLGQQGNKTTDVPIFVGSITIQSSDENNVTIEDWRMGWRFPFGSTIASPGDVFDPTVTLLTPNSSTVVLEHLDLSRPLEPGSTMQFGFLGTKGSASQLNASNPFNVGAIQNVVFQNLLCTMVTAAPPPPAVPPAAGPPASVANPNLVEVQYTPVEYLGQPLVSTFTQFLVRVRNIQNASALSLAGLRLQYWLEAPEGGPPPPAGARPDQLFTVQCEWSTTGCGSVDLRMAPGYPGVEGAQYALNITLNAGAGLLTPSGAAAVPALFLGSKGVDVWDVLDFSFMDTPTLPADANTTIIPRRALPNPHIPAYVNGTMVWGQLPLAQQPAEFIARAVAPAAVPAPTAEAGDVLPPGITCAVSAGVRTCGLAAVYCCSAAEPVDPTIPEHWPPSHTHGAPTTEVVLVPVSPSAEPGVQIAPAPSGGNASSRGNVSSSSIGNATSSSKVSSTPASGRSGSGGGLAGGIAGAVAGVAAVAGAAAFLLVHRRRRRRRQQERRPGEGPDLEEGKALDVRNGLPLLPPPGGVPPAASPRKAHPQLPAVLAHAGRQSAVAPWQPAPGSEHGSTHSSPSRQSQLPLLGARGQLYKFPSGMSGVSDNPLFDPQGSADDGGEQELGPLPQHVARWEGGGGAAPPRATRHTRGGGAAAQVDTPEGGEAGAPLSPRLPGSPQADPLAPEVLRMLERKAATAPSRLEPSGGCSEGGEGGGCLAGTSTLPPLAWQLRRTKSWAGVMEARGADGGKHRTRVIGGYSEHSTHGLDSLPLMMRRRKAEPTIHSIPPLTELPPPVLPSSQPAQARGVRRRALCACCPILRSLELELFVLSSSSCIILWPSSIIHLQDVDLNVDFGEIQLGRALGTGGFGTVYEAAWRGRRVAVKMLNPVLACKGSAMAGASTAALVREIELAAKFTSDRLELMEGGSLFQRIYDRKRRRMSYLEILQARRCCVNSSEQGNSRLSVPNCCVDGEGGNELAHDVAAGLAYLHPSVIHRDLKPQNLLMDAEGRIKLADFGISKIKDPAKSYLSQVTSDNGTPMYMAPEQFNGSRVDVYALGCILNEAFCRRQPWRDSTHFFQIILKVAINGERPWIDPDTPEPLRKLITKCWHQDPHMRPSTAEIMRLTGWLIADEVRRWEALNSIGPGGRRASVGVPGAARPTSAAGGGGGNGVAAVGAGSGAVAT
eukprot:scaffold15.g4370.t1